MAQGHCWSRDGQGKLQNPLLGGKCAVAHGLGSQKGPSSLAGAAWACGTFKKKVVLGFFQEFLQGETSLLWPFPGGTPSLVGEDGGSGISPLLSHLGRSGASRGCLEFWALQGWLLGSWGGREGRQNLPCGCCGPGQRVPAGINKSRANSHPGVSWINKCLGRDLPEGICWESPAGLGMGDFNTPDQPGL